MDPNPDAIAPKCKSISQPLAARRLTVEQFARGPTPDEGDAKSLLRSGQGDRSGFDSVIVPTQTPASAPSQFLSIEVFQSRDTSGRAATGPECSCRSHV